MRICVVCADTGIPVPGTKGASLHLLAITEALAAIGHDVLLVGLAGREHWTGRSRVVLLPHPGRSEGLEREQRKLEFCKRLVDVAMPVVSGFTPDIVYERLSLFSDAGARLAAGTAGGYVLEVNSLLAEEESCWRGLHLEELGQQRQREALVGAELRVAVSGDLAKRIQELAPGGPTVVLPNGVDARSFQQLPERLSARRSLALPEDGRMVGFAGTLRPWHGLDTAVRALGLLPGVELVIAGDGPTRPELEALAARTGVSGRLRWLGPLPHSAIPAFLRALDVALLPYPALPGFAFSPLKLFEYLAAGVPVVASDLGQVRVTLEHGRWGLLVRPGDPVALAQGVRDVLGSPEAAARAMAARRLTLRDHSWERRARQLEAHFQDLLECGDAARHGPLPARHALPV